MEKKVIHEKFKIYFIITPFRKQFEQKHVTFTNCGK